MPLEYGEDDELFFFLGALMFESKISKSLQVNMAYGFGPQFRFGSDNVQHIRVIFCRFSLSVLEMGHELTAPLWESFRVGHGDDDVVESRRSSSCSSCCR